MNAAIQKKSSFPADACCFGTWFAVRVQLLQCLHIHLATLQSGNALGGSARSGESCYGRNAGGDGGAADRLLVEERVGPLRCVDDQLNAIAFDEIDHIGAAFFYFVNPITSHSCRFNHIGCTSSSDQLESHVNELPCDFRDVRLVVIGDADEEGALR